MSRYGRAQPAAPAFGRVPPPTYSLLTDVIINNTGTIRSLEAVVWSWFPGGRIGVAMASPRHGSGTTDSNGRLAVIPLPAGAGLTLVAKQNTDATDDDSYLQAGTPSQV